MKPYKYKRIAPVARPENSGRLRRAEEKEVLSGMVQGEKASDIEERFARALDKLGISYTFQQHYFGPAKNTPGAIQIDFMVTSGASQVPVQIDGEIAHKTLSQREEDRIKDTRLNAYFARVGINPVIRIPNGVTQLITDLDTQESTDRIAARLFG